MGAILGVLFTIISVLAVSLQGPRRQVHHVRGLYPLLVHGSFD